MLQCDMSDDKVMQRGYVVLPIAEYERLMAVRRMVRVAERTWGDGTLELELDKRQLYALGIELIKASYSAEELQAFDVASTPEQLNVLDVRIASKKQEE